MALSSISSVPSERPDGGTHILTGSPRGVVPVPDPLCPSCCGPMVLSHRFYAEAGGARMEHFHCRTCKVGFTRADEEEHEDDED
jgi:hypothetical protein